MSASAAWKGGMAQGFGARFVLRDPVGSGGMATVYRALDRHTGDTVAVKLLHAGDPTTLARFDQEVEALAALDHPAVVRLLAHGKWPDGRPSIAMEWLEGEDLATRLGRGALEPREVVSLSLRVAEALAAAHARGIVHRDIKPGNLFLPGGSVERVKLIDFGIARLSSQAPITAAGSVVGSPGYMAPEQAVGETEVDARADVFSLGAVMFECLTGRPPFVAEHAAAVLAKILFEPVPAVNEICPDVPDALSELVARMLSKGREARPQSGAEVVRALREISRVAHAWPVSRERASLSLAPAERERRFAACVAVRPAGIDEAAGAATGERLRAAVAPLGARVASLGNGVQIMTWAGAEAPAEQSARAARCALIAGNLEPEAAIVLASGFCDSSEPDAVWRVLDHAASLLSAEAPGPGRGIRIDASTASLLDPRFDLRRAPWGWELAGERETGTGVRTLLGRASPYVGRTSELGALLETVNACVEGRVPSAVLVTGEAGMGKSRLGHELCQQLDGRLSAESTWLGRGDWMTAGSAFATLGSALRATAGIASHEPLSERQDKLAARVARSVPGPERARITAFLGELAGAPFPDELCPLLAPARDSAAVMVERVRQAWLDFVDAECAVHPVLIVLDDLHWGDRPSLDLLDATLEELPGRPVLVLALARPEVRDAFPRLWENRNMLGIRLAGLPAAAAARLVRQVLGDSLDAALAERIVERAGGNAFYLEEMIRAVADGRSHALPDPVLAMVQARLDLLSAPERAVLRAASVLGETFSRRDVEALLDGNLHPAQVSACLDAVVSKEILTTSRGGRFGGEPELAFRHALLRDGACALWSESGRRVAHLRAAAWLEEVGEDDAVDLARGRASAALSVTRPVIEDDGSAPPDPGYVRPHLGEPGAGRAGDHGRTRPVLAGAPREVLATASRPDNPALRATFARLLDGRADGRPARGAIATVPLALYFAAIRRPGWARRVTGRRSSGDRVSSPEGRVSSSDGRVSDSDAPIRLRGAVCRRSRAPRPAKCWASLTGGRSIRTVTPWHARCFAARNANVQVKRTGRLTERWGGRNGDSGRAHREEWT